MNVLTIAAVIYCIGFLASVVFMFRYFSKYGIEESSGFEGMLTTICSLIWPVTWLMIIIEVLSFKQRKKKEKHF